ncbi:MAG: hydrogenase maturation nickel metallochaperone HypA [Candidatus Omnitrophota bacterium]
MHEMGIAQEVFKSVLLELKDYEYKKINKIVLEVGEYNLIEPESLQNAFRLIAENSRANNAILEIKQIPGMEIKIIHIDAE